MGEDNKEHLEPDYYHEIGVLSQVEPAKTPPWCVSSFIVPKKNGKVRLSKTFVMMSDSESAL
jgi:hypothetical protein